MPVPYVSPSPVLNRRVERLREPADRTRYLATTGGGRPADVRSAALESWRWTRELAAEASARWGTALPIQLHEEIAELLTEG